MFEQETIDLYKKLVKEAAETDIGWRHSPVEDWKIDYFAKNFNENNLINFRRTPLVEGVISFPDRPLRKGVRLTQPWLSGLPLWQKIRGIRDILVELYPLNSYFKINLSEVGDSPVGNPCYYSFGNIKITDLAIRMCFYRKYIEKEFKHASNILEIGGGFGGLCLKLMQSKILNPQKYFFTDLPENLALAFYYLKNNNFNVKVFERGQDIERDSGKVVYIVAPWKLKDLNVRMDLFINTMSFQHMTRENIVYYLSEINRLNTKNLFLVNRDGKRDATDLKISEYPIPEKYILSKEEKYLFSNHLMRKYSLIN